MPTVRVSGSEPVLRVASADDAAEFRTVFMHNFHVEFDPVTDAVLERPLFEPDRCFGFAVDGEWISTTGAYSIALSVPGGSVPAAGVSSVSVSPIHRRKGLLTRMMSHQLEDIRDRGREPVAVLWASEAAIYGRYGYGQAVQEHRISGATAGTAFLPDVESAPGRVVEVSAEMFAGIAPELRATAIAGRPGGIVRDQRWWTRRLFDPPERRGGASARRYYVHVDEQDDADGYAMFVVRAATGPEGPQNEVAILELEGREGRIRAALWRSVLDLDLVRRFSASIPVDDPLPSQLADRRALTATVADTLYLRVVDVPRALEARSYSAELDVVLEIGDRILAANAGRFRLTGGRDGVRVSRVADEPDVTMTARELGAIYLGGVPLRRLADAGLVREHRPGAVAELTNAFAGDRAPFCPDFF